MRVLEHESCVEMHDMGSDKMVMITRTNHGCVVQIVLVIV